MPLGPDHSFTELILQGIYKCKYKNVNVKKKINAKDWTKIYIE